jgi:hypothetical protein
MTLDEYLHGTASYNKTCVSPEYLGVIADYIELQGSIMRENGSTPKEIAQMAQTVCETYNAPLPAEYIKRKLYLSGWYWRIKQRKGAKRAVVALARKLLSIIYIM